MTYLTNINIKISLVIGIDKYVEGDLTRHGLNYQWPLIIGADRKPVGHAHNALSSRAKF